MSLSRRPRPPASPLPPPARPGCAATFMFLPRFSAHRKKRYEKFQAVSFRAGTPGELDFIRMVSSVYRSWLYEGHSPGWRFAVGPEVCQSPHSAGEATGVPLVTPGGWAAPIGSTHTRPSPAAPGRDPSTAPVVVTFAPPSLSPGMCVSHFSGPQTWGLCAEGAGAPLSCRKTTAIAGRCLALSAPGAAGQLLEARGRGPNLQNGGGRNMVRREPAGGMASQRDVSLTTPHNPHHGHLWRMGQRTGRFQPGVTAGELACIYRQPHSTCGFISVFTGLFKTF